MGIVFTRPCSHFSHSDSLPGKHSSTLNQASPWARPKNAAEQVAEQAAGSWRWMRGRAGGKEAEWGSGGRASLLLGWLGTR